MHPLGGVWSVGNISKNQSKSLNAWYLGPLLTVAAGFFDGKHVIVEPLADPCTMLPSRYHRREQRLAHVLSFTRKAIQTLSQPRYTGVPLGPPSVANGPPARANRLLQELQGFTHRTSTH